MKNKQGISLIVLVITIIVMIVLAGAIIISLNNNGIINQAQNAVKQTNINQVKQLATLKWSEAYNQGIRKQAELEQYVLNGLIDNDIDLLADDTCVVLVSENGVDFSDVDRHTYLNHDDVIPEDGIYNRDYDGEEKHAGETFPTPGEYDIYTYGDYEYHYKTDEFGYPIEYDGWSVNIKKGQENKATYGLILESIAGKPVIYARSLFAGNQKLEYMSPDFEISDNIKDMESMFANTTIKYAKMRIGSNVENMTGAFGSCHYLTEIDLVIPASVKTMDYSFTGCGVKLNGLTGTLKIEAVPDDYSYAFHACDIRKLTLICDREMEIALRASSRLY